MKSIVNEKAGQRLEAFYFEVEGSSGVRYFINGQLVKEETFDGKNIYFAESAAQNWVDGIKTLNG